jgi:acyl-coenzyme A synthetase/AMP-(fatty) acid ligase
MDHGIVPAPDPNLVTRVMPNAAAYRRTGVWDGATLCRAVESKAGADPGAVAVVDRLGERIVTYSQLDRDSNRFANLLITSGVEVGDVVAVQLPNWYETIVADVGVLKAGAVLNPMLPVYREKELTYMLALTGAKVFVTPAEYRGTDHRRLAQTVIERVAHNVHHIAVPDPESGDSSFREWLQQSPSSSCGRIRDASDVSQIIFTSGTEADPKAIMHSEETASSNIRAVWTSLGMSSSDVVWMPSPIGHSTGFNFGVRIALSHGVPLILQDRWDAREAAALVASRRPTYTVAATTFLTDLVRAVRETGSDVGSLRVFGCGGAPVPAHVVAAGEEVGINVLRLYGQTEVLLATWNRPDSPAQKRTDTDGNAIDGVDVEIRDENGLRVPAGTEGEIYVRSSGTCVGFFRDPVRTAAKFDDGWVLTGDLGVLDDDGYLRIVGRKSEIIIRGGMNITPREIEDQISTINGVRSVAVVGVPDERLGELTCACLVLDDGVQLDLDTVASHLKELGMATYKLPQRLEIVDSIPMTSTGKVQRHVLLAGMVQP